ncbi:MAG: flippase-like domain-containing protein [Ruminococcus sp.]|nr:flippase-like domain-containing protein [Ruminococcus sp.]MBP5582086.1 flippase-like domain-containing protein [Ruminococcus sp.]
MKDKINLKKLMKLAGHLVVIAALAFVIKKIIDMDIKLSDLSSPRVIAAFAISFVIQTAQIIIGCWSWLLFTRSLSGQKIPYSAAMPVFTRSNIYKYLPGNVFQYVGRNQLAADMKISHVDVACATVLDVLFCVFWTGVVSVLLLGSRIGSLFEKYGKNLFIVAAAGILLLTAAFIVLRLKFRDKLKAYLSRYSKAFEKNNRPQLLGGIFYFLAHNCVSAAMYMGCVALIVPQADMKEVAALTGAFLFAWIIGFVTPGAPGGIGIREGVMLFVCGEKFADRIVLFVLVMRIASVFADVAAFVIGKLYGSKAVRAKNNCK